MDSTKAPQPGSPPNQILSALPAPDYHRIEPYLERMALSVRDLMYDVNVVIEHVYFPENCVCSIIGLMADGSAVETATVGNEGMIGIPIFHGTDRTSSQAFCQVPGNALKLPAEVFRDALRHSGTLTYLMHRYSQALFALIGQTSACNRLHKMSERCARWLLLTHDRVDRKPKFNLTQQFLAQMLGVRRATVTEAMSALQAAGAVNYQMGIIEVKDRTLLENLACECYAIVRNEFDRLLNDQQFRGEPSPNPLDGIQTSVGGKSIVTEPKHEGDWTG
jgi:CRP-like cAMP-binding protein